MARSIQMSDHFFKEQRMKIDLSPREIELLLILINEAVSGDFSLDGPPIYTTEELTLIKKLESALETIEKNGHNSPGQISDSKH